MNRKKAILLAAIVETLVLAILVGLFFTGSMSFNLFIALAVVVGIVFSAAVLVIIKKTNP